MFNSPFVDVFSSVFKELGNKYEGFTLRGAVHTSGIYPSSRLSESYVGRCWTPDQGGVYRVAGSGYGQVRGAKLATTVAEGAILGPELVTNEADRTFSSDTGWWTKGTGWGISGGAAVCSSGSASLERLGGEGAIAGRLYMVVYTVFRTAGTIYARIKGTYGTGRNTSGTFVEVITAAGATSIEFVGSAFTGSIDNVSIREVIPVWIAPDTYPTRSVRTRFGTARVPTGTSVGMVSSPAFTNKVTARKTNPTDTTNLTKGGDAASVLSVVDDVAALAAAGLSQICSTGKVYKLDNSAGSATAYAAMSGATGNTNGHSLSAYCRATSGVGQLINAAGSFFENIVGATYKRYYRLAFTPPSIYDRVAIAAPAGAVVHFILPELVESSYLPADPIVPLTAAADTAAAFTRAAIYMEEDTAGVFPTVTEVAREYMQNNCFATLGAGGADVFAGWAEFALGSSTVTQELVDLPAGFTSACKLTTDSSNSICYVQSITIAHPVVAGQTPILSFYAKSNAGNGLKFTIAITNGVTPLYLSGDGNTWGATGAEWSPTDLPITWGKYLKNLPTIPNGYNSVHAIQVARHIGASASRYITGISIGDTGIQNPYSSAASLMSDGSVVPVVSGASWAQNFAVFGTCVPDAGGQGNLDVVSSRADAATYCDFIRTSAAGTFIRFQKIFAGTGTTLDVSYAHAANAPFDYLAIQTIHGMAIRIRPHATMTWSAWTTIVTTNGKKPAPIGSKYQIGALNGGNGIAGKHPKVSIFELGNQASLAAYQDRAMLLAGRITG